MRLRLPLAGVIVLAGLTVLAGPGHAQHRHAWGWGVADTLVADFTDYHTRVGVDRAAAAALRAAPTATFTIEYVDVPASVRPAVVYAFDIWSTHIASSEPIRVRVIGEEAPGGTLAFAAPRLIANFSGALDPNTFYPTALASSLAGRNLNPNDPDIEITYNATFDRWYFGIEGTPPTGRFDFVSVILHEIGHGLGFIGSMRVQNEVGRWGLDPAGFPLVLDRFTETDLDGITTALLNTTRFPNPSPALGLALQSNAVFFDAPVARQAEVESQSAQGLPVNPGGRPQLHAPDNWAPGSSYGHLTEIRGPDAREIYYPPGSLNSLMTPTIGATEVIHTPGPVFCGMLRDMGWALGTGCLALLDLGEPALDVPLQVVGPFPNPVRSASCLRVHVPETARVRVTVYDLLGRRVSVPFDDRITATPPAGEDAALTCGSPAMGYVPLNTAGLASGVYLVRVSTPGAQQTVRLTVVR